MLVTLCFFSCFKKRTWGILSFIQSEKNDKQKYTEIKFSGKILHIYYNITGLISV